MEEVKMENKEDKSKYQFINEALFFPEKGILVFGDLHLGYDYQIQQSGILIPERQIENIKERLGKIINKAKPKVNKIVFLGDISHSFGFEFEERDEFREIINFLSEKVSKENIILIKGNHDTMDYTFDKKIKPYHIGDGIAFLHGHESFPEIYGKNVNLIVSGHLHPSVILQESPGIKREMYKCFITGKTKGKSFIILPSFLRIAEGTPVNDYKEYYIESFAIIPRKDVLNAEVHVIGKDKIYRFGKVKEL
jgi:hypothetical protein